jgi:hypothetical protein
VISDIILFESLYETLLNTHLCVVQIGKNINLDKYDSKRFTKYISSYKLYDAINEDITFFTTKSYDGKIWEFKDKFLKGDYILNTSGIHTKI